ncbi:hypothetical protein GYMLUDRAFT_243647 [Collybiopsis luxurians FD-317 M1]|uniref:Ubinuclein middle domain-containing protein n=1 Tax=Collybiopsis luxurians FD-317 M1 TaxID=944289 RepID=A0A0D0BCT1_9AGAR|nr:hypothetical protein GYMLUDRAFT_243647 [Collybiopsis luxurians FD-317 M1]
MLHRWQELADEKSRLEEEALELRDQLEKSQLECAAREEEKLAMAAKMKELSDSYLAKIDYTLHLSAKLKKTKDERDLLRRERDAFRIELDGGMALAIDPRGSSTEGGAIGVSPASINHDDGDNEEVEVAMTSVTKPQTSAPQTSFTEDDTNGPSFSSSYHNDNDKEADIVTFMQARARNSITDDRSPETSGRSSINTNPIPIHNLIKNTLRVPPTMPFKLKGQCGDEAQNDGSDGPGDAQLRPNSSITNPSAVQYGSMTTGVSAPLKGNTGILKKLQWYQDSSKKEDEYEEEMDSDRYGDGQESSGMKRKRHNSWMIEKKDFIHITSFSPQLQDLLRRLQEAAASAIWVDRKLPGTLKSVILQVAIRAIILDEYDNRFFSFISTVLPLNIRKVFKLVKRLVFQNHLELLTDRQEALLNELQRQIDEAFPKVKKRWEEKREEYLQSSQLDPQQEISGNRYTWNQDLKAIIWELILLSHECYRLRKEKAELEGVSYKGPSERNIRSQMQDKIVSRFPAGSMSKKAISKAVSRIKRGLEENGDQSKSLRP